MTTPVLDYRSDTLTKPTPEMRAAMASAEVGDDVFQEDPTVNELQEQIADRLGKEAALYVPSGSMSNQIAILVHCQPGDELICESGCHIYNYEQGAFAQIGGVVARTLDGEFGVLEPSQFENTVRPDDDHSVRTRLVCLENTHNRGAGRIQPYQHVESICRWAHDQGLVTHLDGARLFNAAVASGIGLAEWAQHFDTVSVCFSKGLGAPVGSALVGPHDLIRDARRKRKCLGGGMRQAGIIAAGALYALNHHFDRLEEDHRHAAALGAGIGGITGLTLQPAQIDSNIVVFRLDEELGTAQAFVQRLAKQGVLMLNLGPQIVRAVTHLDVPPADVDRAIQAIENVASQAAAVA